MITVEEEGIIDKKKVWRFYVLSDNSDRVVLKLNYYSEMARKSPRHKFIVFKHWNRIDSRSSTIKESEVPLPDWVQARAIRQLQIAVEK
jgi:hypothetical protein